MRSSQEYRPEIDGVRALAVVGVILFHLRLGAFQGGYSGVDIFFVISGFLITRNILHDVAAGDFSFAEFYARRLRRIFPALLSTIIITFLAGFLWFPPDALKLLASAATASVFSVSNIYFWMGTQGYFVPASDYLPLLHFWSLSVEEQFYLFWPIFLLLISQRRLRNVLPGIVAFVSIFSLIEAQRWLSRDASAVFYLTPFRAYQFGLGALLLFIEDTLRPRVILRQTIFLLGVFLVAIAYCCFGGQSRVPSLAASVGGMCLIGAGRAPIISILITNRVATAIGAISYSLYLCHWPIIVFANYIFGDLTGNATANVSIVVVTLLCSLTMYFCVEKPFRLAPRAADPGRYSRTFAIFAALTIFVGGLTATASAQGGWFWRLTDRQQEINRGEKFGMFPCHQSHLNDCVFGSITGPVGVVVIGDSYVEQYVAGLHIVARELGLRGAAFTHGGCLGLLGVRRINYVEEKECRDGRDLSLALAKSSNAPVVIGQAWMGYALGSIGDDDSKPTAFRSEEERLGILRTALEKTIRFLGSDRRVLIIGAQVLAPCDIEAYRFGAGPLWHRPARDCAPLPLVTARGETAAVNMMLRSLELKYPSQVSLLLPEDYLCDAVCRFQRDGVWLYQDQGHLTVAGSEYIARRAYDKLKAFLLVGPKSDPS
ncbi:Peptidoglycan/LPS O-acetylase OafA/YrhL, contains acyltransferase and SGNH-hydrolase domains [Bradyrhizobium lablabi]|uniref:Peptidoglycan/LPS O-acetylase OafA/YrhL, contains acyltransferase and SGNH-hydrolase domains n=1 Tax=Bradyrhizobium lablabi TaxID=722472 RepID=A0A1M7BFX5_9BRAD|nr:acyltransferase family protein [Bradyrhizobium lablabi]SHL53519.1 Peptidoglycan/LPS O-acetylase OafA/YrhL, contains acyltransferase and SGNH-hydrolase domains [Bradyrhizobium lablabi]